MRIIELEQQFIGQLLSVSFNRFQRLIDEIGTFSQYFTVAFFLEGHDGEKPILCLLHVMALHVHIEMVLNQFGQGDVNT